jgi:hypothetical protein
LMSTAADHSESKARLAAFLQRLQELGWVDGRNARIDVPLSASGSIESTELIQSRRCSSTVCGTRHAAHGFRHSE